MGLLLALPSVRLLAGREEMPWPWPEPELTKANGKLKWIEEGGDYPLPYDLAGRRAFSIKAGTCGLAAPVLILLDGTQIQPTEDRCREVAKIQCPTKLDHEMAYRWVQSDPLNEPDGPRSFDYWNDDRMSRERKPWGWLYFTFGGKA